ncbi:MAG: hypothetical protein C0597_07420 [Marinilabiliales bacterium]|nr:MAG: hypothetical protein C0597_07420 [Marinilabiliales bacterium]
MKKNFITLSILLTISSLWAQSPEKMSYQAIVRNSNDELVVNGEIGMEISILRGSANGTIIYSETQNPTSNENGLISIEIGGTLANVIFGSFSSIEWSDGFYFIRVKTDPTGGTNYTISGTSQLLSVPYALHAKSAETLTEPIEEVDGSITNEIQDLQLNGDILKITNNPTSTNIDLSKYLNKDTIIILDSINIIAGNGITVSGSYPDIVISQSEKHYVGELMGTNGEDGVVFWVDHTGEHGLICSPEDLNGGTIIGWTDVIAVVPDGAQSRIDGYSNSIAINNQSANSAATICLQYSTPGTSAGDWYLPAVDELSKLYHVRYEVTKALNLDSFGLDMYWTSTELNNNTAWYYNIAIGYGNSLNKNNNYMVRAVRAF